jgi:hypothetical protein
LAARPSARRGHRPSAATSGVGFVVALGATRIASAFVCFRQGESRIPSEASGGS